MPDDTAKLDLLQTTIIDAATDALKPCVAINGHIGRLPDLDKGANLVDTLSRFLATRKEINTVQTGMHFSQETIELYRRFLREELGLDRRSGLPDLESATLHTALNEVERCLAIVKGS